MRLYILLRYIHCRHKTNCRQRYTNLQENLAT